jgi:hypothetical protein
MFLRSVSLFTVTMAIVGAAHGADQGRKKEALAFLQNELGGGVCVSERLLVAMKKYDVTKESSKKVAQLFSRGRNGTSNIGAEMNGKLYKNLYTAQIIDGVYGFNINFENL